MKIKKGQKQKLETGSYSTFYFLFFRFSFFIILLSTFYFLFSNTEVRAAGASLILSPSSESFVVGDNVSVEVKVDTGGASINAVEATVYFPVDNLEVLNISKNDAVFSLWPVEPVFDNINGIISFAGGLPHPGFNEPENLITIEFRAKKEGDAPLSFDRAQVLADDGQGTDILTYLQSAKYVVVAQAPVSLGEETFQIFSSTHPKENEWYSNNRPSFEWFLAQGVVGVSFALEQNEKTIPEPISQGPVQFKNYESVPSGVWYFHLRFLNESGWQAEPAHYKIQIDNAPPRPFEVVVDNAGDPTNPKPNLYFETDDDISGVSHYKLQIDKESFVRLMLAQVNPFPLSIQSPGRHKIVVRAVDQAGNNIETKTILDVAPIASPKITLWPQIYLAGEEAFYLEGQAPADSEITIFLKKDGRDVKKWQVLSDSQGAWFLSVKDLIKSGAYELSAQAKDKRGAQSYISAAYPMAVSFKGLSLGPLMVSFKTLVLLLLLLLLSGIAALGVFIYRINATKKLLRRETKEAEDILHRVFGALREEVKEQIELFDARPGFNEKEKKVYDDLKAALDVSEDLIQKEINDVEKELK